MYDDSGVTSIAFYLPQFRPTPENDEWWGRGFTEWVNASKARPLFPGHYQPRLPGELGFYDLRLEETRVRQAALAADHGISAFCFWHYWFGDGRRMLAELEREWLDTGVPDFPFCLGWANESWGGTWAGAKQDLFIEQRYPGDDDHRRHFDALWPAFHDSRYLRVDGRPVFYVMLPDAVPDIHAAVSLWRELAEQAGLPGLFLVGEARRSTPAAALEPFDAVAPWDLVPRQRRDWGGTWRRRLTPAWWNLRTAVRSDRLPTVLRFPTWAPLWPATVEGRLSCPTVMPGWDNTARRGRQATVFHGSTPEVWADEVARALRLLDEQPAGRRVLFVRSWNEWAEANYLEPDRRWGRAYLEAFRDTVDAHRWPD